MFVVYLVAGLVGLMFAALSLAGLERDKSL
jgi:hypothetical protein